MVHEGRRIWVLDWSGVKPEREPIRLELEESGRECRGSESRLSAASWFSPGLLQVLHLKAPLILLAPHRASVFNTCVPFPMSELEVQQTVSLHPPPPQFAAPRCQCISPLRRIWRYSPGPSARRCHELFAVNPTVEGRDETLPALTVFTCGSESKTSRGSAEKLRLLRERVEKCKPATVVYGNLRFGK